MSQTSRVTLRIAAWSFCSLFTCLLATSAAQDKPPVGTTGGMSAEEKAMMDAMLKASTPGANHELLASMAGDWTFTTKMWTDPAAPPTESTGTASYTTLLGGRFIQGEYRGNMMGMPFEGLGITGYDNVSQQFQASWIDNMGTMLMYMTGHYDPSAKSFTFTGQMDDFMKPGTKVKVREVIRVPSSDSQVMEWYEVRGGKETKTMEITYTRKQ